MHKCSSVASKVLIPFAVLALMAGLAVLSSGCSGGGSNNKALKPSPKPRLAFEYDDNTLRFEDEQLILDLVLSNRTEYDLEDVDLTIKAGEGAADKFEKQLKASTWRRGEERRVAFPVLNNDLDAYHQPSTPRCAFEITGSGYIQIEGGRRQKVEVDTLPWWVSSPLSVRGASEWQPWKASLEATVKIRNGVGSLELTRSEELPALKNIKLLVVGYTGKGDKKKEEFRKLYSLGSVGSKTMSIPVPPTDFTEIRVRGVGHRVVASAKDVGQEKKVFYICDNHHFKWSKD